MFHEEVVLWLEKHQGNWGHGLELGICLQDMLPILERVQQIMDLRAQLDCTANEGDYAKVRSHHKVCLSSMGEIACLPKLQF